MTRSIVILGLLLTTALAACVSNPPKTCTSTPCEELPLPEEPAFIQWPEGTPFPPLPVNQTLRSIRNEGCWGMLGMMQAPEANVRKVLPPDFSTASLVPLTSMVLFEALHCDRIVVGNKVVQDVYSFYVTLAVVLKNETWGTEGRSFFEFERYFSSEEVASFYRGLGIPAETATFDVDVLPVLSDKGMTWAVTHGSSKFSFEYPIVKPDDSNDSLTIYTWTGSNPYLQINHEMSKTFDGNLPAGVLRLEGSSKTSELLGAPVGPWVGNMYPSFNEVIFVEPTLFVGGST